VADPHVRSTSRMLRFGWLMMTTVVSLDGVVTALISLAPFVLVVAVCTAETHIHTVLEDFFFTA